MLKNVVLSRETPGSDALYGTATLDIGPSGIPVDIARATIKSGIDGYTITEGALYITKAFEIPELGITIASMNITPQANRAVVSGYVKSTTGGQNIVGSLHAIEFMDAELHPGYIGISGISDFRYEQFTFKGVNTCHIALGAGGTDSEYFIQMDAEEIYMKSHLETLNNESFQLERSYLAFDRQGKMTAEFFTKPGTEQFLQLLVPGGAGLRVGKATVRYDRGIALASGTLQGRLILPFENAALSAADPDFGAAGVYTGHPDSNEMDELAAASGVSGGDYALNDCLNKFGQKVQQNALLIVPQDHALQELCSYADVHVENWSGKGFTMAEATLTPTSVTNRNLDLATQREQATVVAPTRVSVDLDRDAYIPPESVWGERAPNEYMNKETMLPMETQKSFWVGLVVHGGTVGLPPAFIQGNNNETITFDLAPGEMIYDLNGFSYQTYLYNNEGVAANFGSALGGFEDVMVYNCLLDMYANRVSLEINAKVRLELFNNEWVNAKLYTNETDNENGRAGEFLCSVAPTLIEAASGAGIDMRIGGGFFKPDGMHFHGEMTLSTDEVRSAEPLAFTDMIVPPKREMTNREFWSLADKDTKDKYNNQKALGLDSDSWMKYGKVTLSKPANVTFQGFTMEVRTLHLEYSQSKTPEQIKRGGGVFAVPLSGHATYLTLSGATVLADNIPLGQENTDVIKLDCRKKTINPKVLYEQCVTVLSANFDDATDLKGALRPNLTPAGESAQQGASGVSAPNSGQGFEVMPLSAGGIPTLPPMPEIPDISKFKGAAEEQVKAYQKALEEEVAQYKKQVEDQVKGLAKEQAEALKKQAQEAMDQYVGDAVNELKGEYEKYKKELSETLEKYKKELMKELEKYIDVGMLGQGLIEFNADTLSFGLLDSLKNAGVDMTVRFGYDIANSRCYYVVGANSVKEDLDLGVMKVSQFAALFHRNVELPTDITKVENLNKIRTSEEMKKYVEDIKVHREADSTFGIAVIGTIKMGDTVMLKDACLYIASGPIISAGGELWAKTTFDEYNLIAAASLCYDHPRRYLSVSVTLKDIPCGIFTVSGSIGLEVGTRPALFGLYLGYPETLKAGKVLGIFEVGAGLGFKISESEMCAMWKMEAGAGLSLDFGIVYASGYLRYGTYGEIKWVSDGPNYFEYTLWAEGQIKGGIWFFGKRDIINIYGRAQGSFIYDGNYRMDAELTLRYKVSLFVASISGSHNWHIGTKF